MSDIAGTIKNTTVQRLIKAVSAAAKAEGRAELLAEISARADHEVKLGLFNVDHFQHDLDKTRLGAEKEQKAFQNQALIVAAMNHIDEQLEAENVINPSIISQLIEYDHTIKASVSDSGQLNVIIESKDGLSGTTLKEHLQKLRLSKEYAFLFAEKPTDSPAKGTGTVNPWKKETFNVTQQGRVYTANPAMAAQMKQEAGIA